MVEMSEIVRITIRRQRGGRARVRLVLDSAVEHRIEGFLAEIVDAPAAGGRYVDAWGTALRRSVSCKWLVIRNGRADGASEEGRTY